MKCIKLSSGKIERVPDERADALVSHGNASFIPKSIWKKEVRDIKKEEVKEVTSEVETKKNKANESIKGKKRKNAE